MIFILIIFTIIQSIFWGLIFSKLLKHKNMDQTHTHCPPISVIICAYNEEENLQKLLPLLMKQEYSIFEIIVVNDKSTDQTNILLNNLAKTHTHFSYINITETPSNFHSKKYALTQGIQQAKYPYLLLTDADCFPTSNHWIEHMAKPTEKHDIVLGYSPYYSEKSFLNELIQFETIYTAIQYLGFAKAGIPYMGVGRNVLYAKKLFEQQQGFQEHQHITGGDDDLFVNAIAHKNNTSICIHPDSFMYSIPKKTWNSWLIQKTRHLSVSKHYQLKHQLILGLLHLSHIGFYLATFLSLYLGNSFNFVTLLFMFRMSLSFMIFHKIERKLKGQLNIQQIIRSDFLYVIYIYCIGIIASLRKKIKWQ